MNYNTVISNFSIIHITHTLEMECVWWSHNSICKYWVFVSTCWVPFKWVLLHCASVEGTFNKILKFNLNCPVIVSTSCNVRYKPNSFGTPCWVKQTIIFKYWMTQVWLECLRIISTFYGLNCTVQKTEDDCIHKNMLKIRKKTNKKTKWFPVVLVKNIK